MEVEWSRRLSLPSPLDPPTTTLSLSLLRSLWTPALRPFTRNQGHSPLHSNRIVFRPGPWSSSDAPFLERESRRRRSRINIELPRLCVPA